MLAIIYIIALFMVPLALHLRGAGPVQLFASVAVVHLGFAGLVSLWFVLAPGSFVWAFAPTQVLLRGGDAIRDSYSVSAGPARAMRSLAGIWAAAALGVYFIARWRALFFPKVVTALFWCLTLALLMSYITTIASTYLVLHRGAAPSPDMVEWITNLKFAAGVALMLSLAGLLALLADAVFRRLRTGPQAN